MQVNAATPRPGGASRGRSSGGGSSGGGGGGKLTSCKYDRALVI